MGSGPIVGSCPMRIRPGGELSRWGKCPGGEWS